MTRKSHSLLMGAMIFGEVEKWWEMADSLGVAVAAKRLLADRKLVEGDSLSITLAGPEEVESRELRSKRKSQVYLGLC